MKKINLIVAILPVLFGLFALQSCTKEDGKITVFHSFSTPTVTAPLDAATVKITGTTVDLKWASTDLDGDTPKADVYFGTSSKPGLYKAANAGLSITVPVELGKTYYWYVTMKDANGVMTYGPTWSFTIFEPVGIYVGDFLCDEPAEDYSYDVSFVKGSATSVITDNYWNSGWTGVFALNFTTNTYSMALTNFTANWSGIEAGTIDPATGKMVGNYTIRYKGAIYETGVHTYTKK
ncbi:MAG: hypothetical protein M0R39_11985 [Prolixibacteraceae bacterium]|nr:hypothetical protein [Prolixibacteraceae bacterium]